MTRRRLALVHAIRTGRLTPCSCTTPGCIEEHPIVPPTEEFVVALEELRFRNALLEVGHESELHARALVRARRECPQVRERIERRRRDRRARRAAA